MFYSQIYHTPHTFKTHAFCLLCLQLHAVGSWFFSTLLRFSSESPSYYAMYSRVHEHGHCTDPWTLIISNLLCKYGAEIIISYKPQCILRYLRWFLCPEMSSSLSLQLQLLLHTPLQHQQKMLAGSIYWFQALGLASPTKHSLVHLWSSLHSHLWRPITHKLQFNVLYLWKGQGKVAEPVGQLYYRRDYHITMV